VAIFGFHGRLKLKKTDEFSSVFNFRKRISGPSLVIYYRPNILGHARLGLIVAKKITHKAVHRNYMKRALREIFRQEQQHLPSFDLVIKPQKTFSTLQAPDVRNEFLHAISRLCKQINATEI
jgi:ribonuclease P protein component